MKEKQINITVVACKRNSEQAQQDDNCGTILVEFRLRQSVLPVLSCESLDRAVVKDRWREPSLSGLMHRFVRRAPSLKRLRGLASLLALRQFSLLYILVSEVKTLLQFASIEDAVFGSINGLRRFDGSRTHQR